MSSGRGCEGHPNPSWDALATCILAQEGETKAGNPGRTKGSREEGRKRTFLEMRVSSVAALCHWRTRFTLADEVTKLETKPGPACFNIPCVCDGALASGMPRWAAWPWASILCAQGTQKPHSVSYSARSWSNGKPEDCFSTWNKVRVWPGCLLQGGKGLGMSLDPISDRGGGVEGRELGSHLCCTLALPLWGEIPVSPLSLN